MDYFKLYKAFINKFKDQTFQEGVYTEVHHILPRYAGGTDDQENLVRVTYKQHVFLHKLWFRVTNDPQAELAYRLMSGLAEDKKKLLCSMAGKIGGARNVASGHIFRLSAEYGKEVGRRNVDSGHLERIRPLSNTPAKFEHLSKLHSLFEVNGHYEKFTKAGNAAWRGSKHTEEYKKARSDQYKEYYSTPEKRKWLADNAKKGREIKQKQVEERSSSVILNAERNEEFLHRTSSRSLNWFISPEGLYFQSPIFAAGYYGNGVKSTTIESWCKNNICGWRTEPKTVRE